MSQPTTEFARCFWHHVDEPYTPGVDYLACGECWHVWPTEADFRRDVDQLCAEMNNSPWRESEPDWVTPTDLSKVYSCPLCSHDF
jgi:hypothetical protein